jgi:TPR repeat protein
MLKGYVSFFALVSIVGSLSGPAWCMENGEEEEGVIQLTPAFQAMNVETIEDQSDPERHRDEDKTKSTPPGKQRKITEDLATLDDCPPEIRAMISSYVLAGEPAEILKNAAALARVDRMFHFEVNSEIGNRTRNLRKSIENSNIEGWQGSPLRAFWQAHCILNVLEEARSQFLRGEEVYLTALKEGSFVSESRVLAYQLAMSWTKHYKCDMEQKGRPNLYIHGDLEFQKRSQKLAKDKIISTLHSLWRDIQNDKAQRQPFDSQKYEAVLQIYLFLRQDPIVSGLFSYFDPVGDELNLISNLSVKELSKYPAEKLNVLAAFFPRFSAPSNENFISIGLGRLFLASAMQNDKIGLFNVACRYLLDAVDRSVFFEDEERYSFVTGEPIEAPPPKVENCDSPKTKNRVYQLLGAYRMRKAAAQGIPEAQNNCAILQLQGIGVDQDFTAAFEGFKKAAEAGLTVGKYNLAVCYADGIGTEQDDFLAQKWFKKAAKAGKMKRAQFTVGLYYDLGKGCVQNYSEAFRWYNIALDPTIDPDLESVRAAKNNLGRCYELGLGVNQNDEMALDIYESGAGQQNIEAYINIAHWHERKGTFQAFKKAEETYRVALKASGLKTKMDLLAKYGTPPIQMGSRNWFFMSYPH